MTLSEALIEGVSTTVLGMVTVFSVLIILMLAIGIMKSIFYRETKKVEETKPVAVEKEVVQVQQPAEEDDEEQLIAVLTAAIAASLNTSTYNLKIKSYRRIENRNPAWNRAAVRDNTNL